jgi:hypothetical protein
MESGTTVCFLKKIDDMIIGGAHGGAHHHDGDTNCENCNYRQRYQTVVSGKIHLH